MKIAKAKIANFKCCEETFTLQLNDGNLIVGANRSGKTMILEAIHLAPTGLPAGRPRKMTSRAISRAAASHDRRNEDIDS